MRESDAIRDALAGRHYEVVLWPDEDPGGSDAELVASLRDALVNSAPAVLCVAVTRVGVEVDDRQRRVLHVATRSGAFHDGELLAAVRVFAPAVSAVASGRPLFDPFDRCRHVEAVGS